MRPLAAILAGSLLVTGATGATGCLSESYRISGAEVARLATLPPEVRGQHVRVTQEFSASEVEPATPIDNNTVLIVGNIDVGPVGGGGGGVRGVSRPPPGAHVLGSGGSGVHTVGGGGGLHGISGGGGGDGKGTAIAILVVATVALIAVAAIEGSRFDGFAELHPMYPVHMFGRDGSYAVVPLAQIDPYMAAWTDHAVVRESEGPWHPLERAPLDRAGWNYSVYFGEATLRSTDGSIAGGTAGTVQFGFFPTQEVGIVGSMFFAWRNNLEDATLFDSRYTLELQAMPLFIGRLHAGAYVGGGTALRLEDGVAGGDRNSAVYDVGAMLQVDVDTRLALTARAGLADAYGDRMSEVLVGLSVY